MSKPEENFRVFRLCSFESVHVARSIKNVLKNSNWLCIFFVYIENGKFGVLPVLGLCFYVKFNLG